MDLKRRLFALRIKWESVRTEFGIRALLDALCAGCVYATLAFFPLFLVLVELMLLAMHRLYTFTVLLILAALAFVYVANRLAAYALKLKRPAHESDAAGLFRLHAYAWMTVVLVVGLLFLIVFIPAMTA